MYYYLLNSMTGNNATLQAQFPQPEQMEVELLPTPLRFIGRQEKRNGKEIALSIRSSMERT